MQKFIGCSGTSYDSAEIVLFGAGFDGTTSYRPGARFGGSVIREQSFGLETYSPVLDRDLMDVKICDIGELELPFGNTQKTLEIIRETAERILSDGKKLFMLGGEHLVTYPVIQACSALHPDLHIVHFDAHTDLRDDYCGEKLSHACVMRRCHELIGDNRIYSHGIRSGTREEYRWAGGKVEINRTDFFECENLRSVFGDKPVYITVDIDVLDPSEFPATGTPEAGGMRYSKLHGYLKRLCRELNVIGADIVEFSPPYDHSGFCAATAGKLLREMLLMIR